MTLRQKQSLFTKLLGQLIVFVYDSGYELTLGEGYVSTKTGHMVGSLHYIKLAQDLNLFVDGVYITSTHPVWNKLGKFWKSLHPLCAWGGDFFSKDYNHFSLEHEGRK